MNDIVLRGSPRVPDSENSAQFHQGMVDRMCVSYYKYGAVADAKGKVNELASLLLRLAKYMGTKALVAEVSKLPVLPKTGNTEWLMDAANFAMIEFMQPSIRGARFKATDSSASPGLVSTPDEFDGTVEISQRAHDGSVL